MAPLWCPGGLARVRMSRAGKGLDCSSSISSMNVSQSSLNISAGEACDELLGDPATSLSLLGTITRSFLIASEVLMRYEEFGAASFKAEMQSINPLYCSSELAP